jgi:LPXTG-motif cell wall-anchored protein
LYVGDTAMFDLVATNGFVATQGPLVFTDNLPVGLEPVNATGEGLTCTTVGSAVRCERAAGLAAGEVVSIVVTTRVAVGAPARITNTASVSVPDVEASVADNVSSASLVLGVPDPPPISPIIPTETPKVPGGALPKTGSDPRNLLWLAGFAIVAGALLLDRRRWSVRRAAKDSSAS